jgi:hypothetical protein
MELSRWCKTEALENPVKKFGNAAISGHFGEYVANGGGLRLFLQQVLSCFSQSAQLK